MTIVRDRPASFDFASARKAMVDSQLRVSGVNADFVRERMGAVPREDFVPAPARSVAYMDRAIALGNGRFLAAPLVQGMMLQEADPQPEDRVLLVDGGSGYLAELLRPLVASLEVLTPVKAAAKGSKQGGASLLLIDGAIEQLPRELAKRVDEGGRVVTGLVVRGLTRLAVGRKAAGEIALAPLAVFVAVVIIVRIAAAIVARVLGVGLSAPSRILAGAASTRLRSQEPARGAAGKLSLAARGRRARAAVPTIPYSRCGPIAPAPAPAGLPAHSRLPSARCGRTASPETRPTRP